MGSGAAGIGRGLGLFLPPLGFLFIAATPPAAARIKQQHTKQTARVHCQRRKKNPDEPDAAEPDVSVEPDTSLSLDPSSREFEEEDFQDPEEAPEAPEDPKLDAPESHGVIVVATTPPGGATVVYV